MTSADNCDERRDDLLGASDQIIVMSEAMAHSQLQLTERVGKLLSKPDNKTGNSSLCSEIVLCYSSKYTMAIFSDKNHYCLRSLAPWLTERLCWRSGAN